MKKIFPAVLTAALTVLPRAHAATSGVEMTNSMADAAAGGTNANPANVMAELFGDPVIAKGNGFEIKQSQLDGVMDAIKAKARNAGQTIPSAELPLITQTALDGLIANQILLQQATDADKAAGQKQVDQIINQAIKVYGSQAAFDTQLKATGKSFDDWRTDETQQQTAMAVMIRQLNAEPTEAEIQKYYNDNTNVSEMPEQVHLRHILLLTIDPATRASLPDDQVKAKKKQADDILKRARAGEDFATLAKQYSDDPNSKDDGGELPLLSRQQLGPDLAATVFSLTNNQVSDVIEMPYGYQIIQLVDKTPAKKLTLTDKVPPSDTTLSDEIKDYLIRQKLQELAPAFIEKLSKSPGVEILDPSLKAIMSEATNAPAEPMAN